MYSVLQFLHLLMMRTMWIRWGSRYRLCVVLAIWERPWGGLQKVLLWFVPREKLVQVSSLALVHTMSVPFSLAIRQCSGSSATCPDHTTWNQHGSLSQLSRALWLCQGARSAVRSSPKNCRTGPITSGQLCCWRTRYKLTYSQRNMSPWLCLYVSATPADVGLLMQLGVDGVFVGSGIFKSGDPEKRARAMVQAVTHYNDPQILAEVSTNLGEAMVYTQHELLDIVYKSLITVSYRSDWIVMTCNRRGLHENRSLPDQYFLSHSLLIDMSHQLFITHTQTDSDYTQCWWSIFLLVRLLTSSTLFLCT